MDVRVSAKSTMSAGYHESPAYVNSIHHFVRVNHDGSHNLAVCEDVLVDNCHTTTDASKLQPFSILTSARLLGFGIPFVGRAFFQTLSRSRGIDDQFVPAVGTVIVCFFDTAFGPFNIVAPACSFGFRVPFVGRASF